MKVHGYEVTPEVEQACLAAMVGQFTYFSVVSAAARSAPTSMEHPVHIADHLIQRERKAGRIKPVGNRWERVVGEGARISSARDMLQERTSILAWKHRILLYHRTPQMQNMQRCP